MKIRGEDVLLQNENKKKIGIYLGVEPCGGGSFQYVQSVLFALNSLPSEQFEVTTFFLNDLWLKYLKKFTFKNKKIYSQRQLMDLGGWLAFKLATLFKIDIWKYKGIIAKISKFSKQFDAEKMDLIIFPSQVYFPAMVETKSVAVIHDLMHRYESFPESSSSLEYARREVLYISILNAATAIFVDSRLGVEQVIESYGEQFVDKLVVMPFTPPQYLFEGKDDELSENVILPDKFVFYPAQFWQHKNHKNLILAAYKLINKGIDIHLVFVGSKKNGYQEVKSLIEEYNLETNIHIIGYVSDALMRDLYRAARAMVMPSFYGPTNIPPLEGMAMGCPVAVSNKYAMPWQVGDGGLTFDPDNVEEIATVIEKLWIDDDLCENLSVKGKKRAKYFSQEEFNARFNKAISRLFS